jgi:hypothetical protein
MVDERKARQTSFFDSATGSASEHRFALYMGSVLFCGGRFDGPFEHITVYPQHILRVSLGRDDTGHIAIMYSRLFKRSATSNVLCMQKLEPR